mmetsp:Transcript_34102/g.55596  ORF Transcript_34102/g.55596 Transcript_34102/m.55596 type:complete len:216 (-) Transcript_34102:93-740(-)
MFATCQKPEDGCTAFCVGVALIVGIILSSLGFYTYKLGYNEYLKNKLSETECEIVDVEVIQNCQYECECDTSLNCNDQCTDGIQFIYDAYTTNLSDTCPDDEHLVQYTTECAVNASNISHTSNLNDTVPCWIPHINNCDNISSFYLTDVNAGNKPNFDEQFGDVLMLCGLISVAVGALYLCCHCLYFKAIKRCMSRNQSEPPEARTQIQLEQYAE